MVGEKRRPFSNNDEMIISKKETNCEVQTLSLSGPVKCIDSGVTHLKINQIVCVYVDNGVWPRQKKFN